MELQNHLNIVVKSDDMGKIVIKRTFNMAGKKNTEDFANVTDEIS